MTITTRPIYIPEGVTGDRILLGLLQGIADRVDKPRVQSVDDLTQAITDPPTGAQVAAIQDKVNELLLRLREANVLDPAPAE